MNCRWQQRLIHVLVFTSVLTCSGSVRLNWFQVSALVFISLSPGVLELGTLIWDQRSRKRLNSLRLRRDSGSSGIKPAVTSSLRCVYIRCAHHEGRETGCECDMGAMLIWEQCSDWTTVVIHRHRAWLRRERFALLGCLVKWNARQQLVFSWTS